MVSALFRKRVGDFSLDRQMPYRPLGRIIVPRNTVVLKEGEQRVSVAYESLLIFRDEFILRCGPIDSVPIESLDTNEVLSEMHRF